MWVFTDRGFFSVVQKHADRAENMVTIRSRTKADLERLSDLIDAKPYQEHHYTDYPWRIRVRKDEWATAMYAMADEINYSNFKDHVKHVLGHHRASVYGRIWAVLLDLESKRGKQGFGYSSHWPVPSDTDGKCRDCKQPISEKHQPYCSIWPGNTVLAADCTRKAARSRSGSKRRSSRSKRTRKAKS